MSLVVVMSWALWNYGFNIHVVSIAKIGIIWEITKENREKMKKKQGDLCIFMRQPLPNP